MAPSNIINFNLLEKKLQDIASSNKVLFVGWPEGEMSKIAGIHEVGCTINVTPKMRGFLAIKFGIYLKKETTQIIIPARAHRKQVIQKNMDKWRKDLGKLLVRYNFDLEKAYTALGIVMVQDYKQVIKSGDFQQLSDATIHIRAKQDIGGSQPLYATGEMERQIYSEVQNHE